MAQWKYERSASPPWKHAWDRPFAGRESHQGEIVSKCACDISEEEKEALLNSAVEWSPTKTWKRPYPKRLYNLHRGIPYEGTHTNPGKSWHGFPVLPDEFASDPRLKDVRQQLEARATKANTLNAYLTWLKKGTDINGEQ